MMFIDTINWNQSGSGLDSSFFVRDTRTTYLSVVLAHETRDLNPIEPLRVSLANDYNSYKLGVPVGLTRNFATVTSAAVAW